METSFSQDRFDMTLSTDTKTKKKPIMLFPSDILLKKLTLHADK